MGFAFNFLRLFQSGSPPMKTITTENPCMTLMAATAADLMTPDPVSIRETATVREAVALFADRGFGAAPVIDDAGRPVGVLSRTDVLLYDREVVRSAVAAGGVGWDELPALCGREGYSVEVVDPTPIRELMTPVVFTIDLDTPANRVVEYMLAMKVHHLFVVDEDNCLVGVVSALDVVRHLRCPD
jgi:CBS domain-containing protein